MTIDPQTLYSLLHRTLSHDQANIKSAEIELGAMERSQRSFPLALLLVVHNGGGRTPSNPSREATAVAISAAIFFKNYAKRNWRRDFSSAPDPEAEQLRTFDIPDEERIQIKRSILDLMCASQPAVQKQLAEAVRVIADCDWPYEWETLLPELVARADPGAGGSSADAGYLGTLSGVLSTMNELFKRFRDSAESHSLLITLKAALDVVQAPLLLLFTQIASLASSNPPVLDVNRLELAYADLRLMTRIWYSLNWQTIPEFFEDHMQQWMDQFHPFLLPTNPFPNRPNDEEAGPAERLRTAIIDCCQLYAEKYNEEFRPHIPRFVQATFTLLVSAGKEPCFDELVCTGMRFVSALVASRANYDMFADENTLRQICELIVVPNLALRASDREGFEDNPLEYLRRDIDSSDEDTRRRVACSFVQNLCKHFDDSITSLCANFIQQLVERYNANPRGEWASKDMAITLFIAVMVRAFTQREGATRVKDASAVVSFLEAHVLPEVVRPDGEVHPILKADAIKFVSTFRQYIPKPVAVNHVLPSLVSALAARSVVVYTYAAHAIDSLLTVREVDPANSMGAIIQYGPNRYGQADIRPHIHSILVQLFSLIDQAGTNSNGRLGNSDNEHLIQCVVRLVAVAKEEVGPIMPKILTQLGHTLNRVASNPVNPVFNHHLFECISACTKYGVQSGAVSVDQLEAVLNPTFERVLNQYVAEFLPYVFQIMAQLLRFRTPASAIPPYYAAIFQGVLTPTPWESRANVPALVTLLEAYLALDAGQVIARDASTIENLIGIFERLLDVRATEDLSFQLLSSVVANCPSARAQLPRAFKKSLIRLQAPPKSINLASQFVVFVAVLVGRQGPSVAAEPLNAMEKDLLVKVAYQIWVPAFPQVRGMAERKACAIGATRLLVEYQVLFDNYMREWTELLIALVQLLAEQVDYVSLSDKSNVNEILERLAESGQATTYSRLHFASDGAPDYFRQVTVPSNFFVAKLAEFAQSRPTVSRIVQNALASKPKLATAFAGWVGSAGVRGL